MATKRWIQDPETHKLIPVEQWIGCNDTESHYIIPDIQPYQSMVTGEMITSRSHHRAHLAQHNCFEIGNEINSAMKTPERKLDREGLRRDIAAAMSRQNLR